MVERSGLRVSFPVEVRTAPADDITLSTASGRETAYIAVHMYRGTPVPGVLHRRRADLDRARRAAALGQDAHPGRRSTSPGSIRASSEFTALRDRLDPERRFGNDYLRRVLGERTAAASRVACPRVRAAAAAVPPRGRRRANPRTWPEWSTVASPGSGTPAQGARILEDRREGARCTGLTQLVT